MFMFLGLRTQHLNFWPLATRSGDPPPTRAVTENICLCLCAFSFPENLSGQFCSCYVFPCFVGIAVVLGPGTSISPFVLFFDAHNGPFDTPKHYVLSTKPKGVSERMVFKMASFLFKARHCDTRLFLYLFGCLCMGNGRNTVLRVLFRRRELTEPQWVLRQTRWVLRKTRWVCFGTQIIGWEELTEFSPRNSVRAKKLTETRFRL